MGDAWSELSELMHGRGPMLEMVRWEAIDLARSDAPLAPGGAKALLAGVHAAMTQVRGCVMTILSMRGEQDAAERFGQMPSIGQLEKVPDAPGPFIFPLTPDLLTCFEAAQGTGWYLPLVSREAISRRFPTDVSCRLVEAGFAERRHRSWRWANQAFRDEAEQLGDDFDPDEVQRRHQAVVLINEMAALTASWMSSGPRSDALIVAASALRSAFWLWLEDDDRAMPLVRLVIEQTARARVWRTKPTAAASAEERSPSRQRWAENAGWRRLSVVSRSLSEFSHASPNSRWSGARSALANVVDIDTAGPSSPEQVARGDVLLRATLLFGAEVDAQLTLVDAKLGETFINALGINWQQVESDNEQWLQRAWVERSFDLGSADFRRPTESEVAQVLGEHG